MITLRNGEDGQVQISEDVIAIIANTTALDIDGVVTPEGSFTGSIAELLRKKNFSKGVKVEIDEERNEIALLINIAIKFGYKISEITLDVQKKVKSAIEMMTGLKVVEVNVNVNGINFEKEKKQDKKSDKK
jgi:uncharacterized alkaline shock family protein YloU